MEEVKGRKWNGGSQREEVKGMKWEGNEVRDEAPDAIKVMVKII